MRPTRSKSASRGVGGATRIGPSHLHRARHQREGDRPPAGDEPRIWDENGQLVFAGIEAGETQLYSLGIVAYSTDLREATSHPRLKVSDAYPFRLPLIIDAQGTRGLPRTDVIIGAADARRIREAVEEYDFLGRFAVVFVLEPFSGL